ncbi:peptidoglycan glycosyltransferase [Coprococcus sp. CLA-AA-H212]|jgi:peptidoglycan glycosyltransferase|uniref:Peptidoglycan glycosyltransferase n=2 Tax=Coprococcus hominis (ex Arizal et al. 2022) TaxID=2881262 RepID=A0ABS8FQA0_9FIRM|nr:penicillin-binding transpeptidase domain-containing protein [Coprococcus hominis (ex Arizal et al. 2022)]MCC2219064.1 peptidoglycan glycosyltransferase [Coprococcus hominis (ex Arizal et al. 2022)]MED9929529.1 penicillin-binding transpeptidase domain-containing protein [Lachnospiraceae bacterium]
MTMQADDYGYRARAVQERERSIKAKRGSIYDRNGVVLAGNQAVCSISVIYNQIEDPETVIRVLSEKLELPEEDVRRRVEKRSVREKIKSNVDKELADEIRAMNLAGVMIDEDYKRYYPYSTLASHVLGFTGSDNQGIVGLEVYYDDLLMGENGSINTVTNARGIEVENMAERRVEGTAGQNLVTSIDINIQQYITQKALEVLEKKQAKRVCIIVMNPQNGEIYALADVPEYNLNEPFTLNYETDETVTQDMWNQMWRNYCISDTYEPGSTFKIVTATTAFEQGVLRVEDQFYCPGYHIVEDRRIRCHKVAGHGAETFREGIMNSCNPVFMQVGERIGVDGFYDGLRKLGLFEQTGVDLPGEANSIFHKQEKVGPVELATMSFGQSFQITPLQLMRAASAVVNGGNLVTPHFGVYTTDENNNVTEVLKYETKTGAVSTATSETMKGLLEAVVAEGTGHRAYIAGYSIGGKTATSEKLPRSENRYISSFLGFSPADNPQVMTLILIDEPQGIYYGGTIAAPVVGEIYDNILPYLGIYKDENAEEETTQTISIDDAVF